VKKNQKDCNNRGADFRQWLELQILALLLAALLAMLYLTNMYHY
jgi:hypothetical protein